MPTPSYNIETRESDSKHIASKTALALAGLAAVTISGIGGYALGRNNAGDELETLRSQYKLSTKDLEAQLENKKASLAVLEERNLGMTAEAKELRARVADLQTTIEFQQTLLEKPVEPTAVPTPEAQTLFSSERQTQFEYKSPKNAQEVAFQRGGDANLWVSKSEKMQVTYLDVNGQVQTKEVDKVEWIYNLNAGGKMSDLKSAFQIPQTREEMVKYLRDSTKGTDLVAEDFLPIMLFEEGNPNHSAWMKDWLKYLPPGTVVGFELIQNKGDELVHHKLALPPGISAEVYDERADANHENDVAATIYNGQKVDSLLLEISGATFWPWGNPSGIAAQQSNYEEAEGVAGTFIITADGKLIYCPTVATNFDGDFSDWLVSPQAWVDEAGIIHLVQ